MNIIGILEADKSFSIMNRIDTIVTLFDSLYDDNFMFTLLLINSKTSKTSIYFYRTLSSF